MHGLDLPFDLIKINVQIFQHAKMLLPIMLNSLYSIFGAVVNQQHHETVSDFEAKEKSVGRLTKKLKNLP
jgi:hypothetical protein